MLRSNEHIGRTVLRLAAVAGVTLLFGCAAPGTARMRVRGYRVRLEGAPDSGLARDLLAMADVTQPRPDAVLDKGRLAVLANRDIPAMQRLMDAHGYFGAEIDAQVLIERRKPVVRFHVEPGDVFGLDRVVSSYPGASPETPGLAEGTAGAPVRLVREARRLQGAWQDRGHAHARVEVDHVVVDRADGTVDLHLAVDPGPASVFGPVSFEGLRRLRQGWLRDTIPWRQGEPWRASLVDAYRAELLASGLFVSAEMDIPESPEAGGSLPLTVLLLERRPRTVGAAAGYRTDEGLGGMVEWTHRNLAGGAERVQVRGEWAEKAQSGLVTFRRPRFLRRDQALRVEADASAEQPDAFEAQSVRTSVHLEREWGERLAAEVGVAGRDVRIEQADRRDHFMLLSIPAGLRWDGRDSAHDPARGGRLFLRATPFHDLGGTGLWFLKNEAAVTRYARLTRRPDLRLAGRAGLGAITGSGPLRIPADERFYAGGGGSVRGYAYQSLAPRDEAGVFGGRSLVETSVELRWRVAGDFGLVAFLDGGTSMRSAWPDASERMYWGTGGGLRYHTAVGPIRIDLGVPLTRRPGIDDPWQIYLSIGQAF